MSTNEFGYLERVDPLPWNDSLELGVADDLEKKQWMSGQLAASTCFDKGGWQTNQVLTVRLCSGS